MLGVVALKRLDRGQSEIGFWVAPAFWNTGIATEAVAALVAANPHRATTLFAACVPGQPGLGAGADELRLRLSGRRESYSVARRATVPTWTYSRRTALSRWPRATLTSKTPRLMLVPVTEVDAGELAAAIGDVEVTRWLPRVPFPYARTDAEAFQRLCAGKEGRQWSVLDADGCVGGIGIANELGYWLARRAWGRGYATEMSSAVLDTFFRRIRSARARRPRSRQARFRRWRGPRLSRRAGRIAA